MSDDDDDATQCVVSDMSVDDGSGACLRGDSTSPRDAMHGTLEKHVRRDVRHLSCVHSLLDSGRGAKVSEPSSPAIVFSTVLPTATTRISGKASGESPAKILE